ncbi:MAG: hypothetical protein ABIH42_10355 [Planctomycetota bacterium]
MENNKITTASEYVLKNAGTKQVTLPSGAVFEIRKISSRAYLQAGGLHLASRVELLLSKEAQAKREEIAKAQLTDEDKIKQLEVMNNLICMAVINPKISMVKDTSGTSICIDDLRDDDYYALITEITNFSDWGRQDLESFRKEQEGAVN